MKLFGFALTSLLAVSSFAAGLSSAEQINQKCLQVLVNKAAEVKFIDGDVYPGEKLADILSLLNNPNILVENNCETVRKDVFECQLIMSAKVGEAGVKYQVNLKAQEVLPTPYISRGH